MNSSFSDNLDLINGDPIRVNAIVSLLTYAQGGRKTPIVGGQTFRPNHNFGDERNINFYIGQINYEDGDLIYPGESRNVQIEFMNVDGLRELLSPEKVWRIQEGSTLIAHGKVVDVRT